MNGLTDYKIIITGTTILVASLLGHILAWLFLKCTRINIRDKDGIGMWLGFVERALIALFVCLGFISQTIFIFAVKAAVLGYRLPDDNKEERKRMSEYMLLGTMASYFIGLSLSLLCLKIMRAFN